MAASASSSSLAPGGDKGKAPARETQADPAASGADAPEVDMDGNSLVMEEGENPWAAYTPLEDLQRDQEDKKEDEEMDDAASEDGEVEDEDDGAGEEDEVEHNKMQPLRPGESIIKNLPQGVFDSLSPFLYPDEFKGIHGHQRGSAAPNPDSLRVEGGGALPSQANRDVALVFHTDKNKAYGIGSPVPPPEKAQSDRRCVQGTFIMNSAVPAYRLNIKGVRHASKTVLVYIFANCVKRWDYGGTKTANIMSLLPGDEKWKEYKLDNALKQAGVKYKLGANECFWSVSMGVYMEDERDTQPFGAPARGVDVLGISKEVLEELKTEAVNLPWGDPKLTPGEWALFGLTQYHSISIVRTWSKSDAARASKLKLDAFWLASMRQAANFGNFAHYRRQAEAQGMSFDDYRLDINAMSPSKEMVKTWRVTVNDAREITAVEAESWAAYERQSRYPDVETFAFTQRLSIERSRGRNEQALQDQLNRKAGSLRGTMYAFQSNRRMFWLEVSVDKSAGPLFSETQTRGALRGNEGLERQTRIRVTILDGEFQGVELSGSSQDDLFNRGHEISAALTVKGDTIPRQGEYDIAIDILTDATSANRMHAAMCQLAKGPRTRNDGVDLGAILLNAAPSIDRTNALADEIVGDEAQEAQFTGTLDYLPLNQEQHEAGMACVASKTKSGALVVWGPPGTGKTTTVVGILSAHCSAGHVSGASKRQIIATAPSNAAVDNLTRKLIASMNDFGQSLRIVRFKGAHRRSRPLRADNELAHEAAARAARAAPGGDQDEDTALDDAVWDYIENNVTPRAQNLKDRDLIPYFFPNAKRTLITECRNTRGHEWADNAEFYAMKQYQLHASKDPHEKDQIRRELEIEDATWDDRTIQSADVILCTNNAAAHELLLEAATPVVAILDEAASCTLADAATPLGAFKETLKYVVICGDHQQQGPAVLSKGRNEGYFEASASFFERLIRDGRTDQVQLRMQHRMKADLSAMVNDIFYQGKLRDHDSLAIMSPLQATIHEGLANGLLNWNGRFRIAADVSGQVSGQDVYSHTEKGGKSMINRAEADQLVGHVEWLLNLTPPAAVAPTEEAEGRPRGRSVRPSDILVISPYNGQCSLIRRLLTAAGIPGVDVMTSATVQGSEREIVLLSWVINNPERPTDVRFTRDKRQLCVNFSRVKEYQVTFGNWRTWMNAEIQKRGFFSREKGKNADFRKVVRHHRVMGDGLSIEHLQALHNGLQPQLQDSLHGRLRDFSHARAIGERQTIPGPGRDDDDAFTGFAERERQRKKKTRRSNMKSRTTFQSAGAGSSGGGFGPPPPGSNRDH